ncbi:MAG: hypothetical protein OSJ51_11875 [Parabacteroides distasonis]|nr:hypothetical protein [Parabacteroides distasonis]
MDCSGFVRSFIGRYTENSWLVPRRYAEV